MKWTPQRKAKTRQTNLRKRIAKKHNVDLDTPQISLFPELLEYAVNAEFTETIHANPDYFINGADPDVSHLPDENDWETYNSQRYAEDAEYRAYWQKKLDIDPEEQEQKLDEIKRLARDHVPAVLAEITKNAKKRMHQKGIQ